MKSSGMVLYFCLVITSAFSQDIYYDSLRRTLSTTSNDTNKVYAYFSIAYSHQWSNPDSALLYALPGLDLAKKLDFERGEYDILLPLTEASSMKGNYSQALKFRFRALELAYHLKDQTKIANSLALIGNVYSYSKEYNKALEYLYRAKETNAVTLGGPKVLNVMIGKAYFLLQKWDSAFAYIQRAYDLEQADTNNRWTEPSHYLAALYEQKGNLVKALALYKESLGMGGANNSIIQNFNGLASVYRKTGQTDSAIHYANQAISLGIAIGITAPVIEASAILVDTYKSSHRIDSALKYQELLMTFKDSLFGKEKIKQMQNVAFDEQQHQQEINIEKRKFENRIRLYALVAVLAVFITIGFILWKNNRAKKIANALLSKKNTEVENALTQLKETQSQLIQKEKMASLGELTAGIAHEIQNPLNFVNNFSEVNKELLIELMDESNKGNIDEVKAIANDVIENSEKINHHGKRADAIVKGMLQHSKASSGQKELTDINRLAEEYLGLAYHGVRAKDKSFNAMIKTEFDDSMDRMNVVRQEIGRVILNLINNAFYAVNEKSKLQAASYEPRVAINTRQIGNKIEIRVKDNGNGIPQKNLDKIFQPFFTTKPTGQGTGLGLSLAYDIVKAHGGEINVETKEEEGTIFIIQLPVV